VPFREGTFCLVRRKKCSSYCRGNFFLDVECYISRFALVPYIIFTGNYWKRNVWENSCLRIGTLTDSKGSCENSGLGMGISGKTSGFIRGTYSRLDRVW
jgi:hypothetical protein